MDKLQKSLTIAHALERGHKLEVKDIKIKVTEPKGINGKYFTNTVGKTLNKDKSADDPIFETDFIV